MPLHLSLILSLLLTLNSIIYITPVPVPKQVPVGQVFTLGLHEQVQFLGSLSGATATLTLTSLTDNRCPVDVLCIQAGEVIVRLELDNGFGTPAKILELKKAASLRLESDNAATMELAEKYSSSIMFGSYYELVLLQALPYPKVETGSKANKVQLRLRYVPGS